MLEGEVELQQLDEEPAVGEHLDMVAEPQPMGVELGKFQDDVVLDEAPVVASVTAACEGAFRLASTGQVEPRVSIAQAYKTAHR